MAGNLRHDAPPAVRQTRPQPQLQYPQDPYPQDPYPQDPYPQDPYVPGQYARPPAAQAEQPQAEQREPQPPLGLDPVIWPVIRRSAARLAMNEHAFTQQLHYDVTKSVQAPPGAPAADTWVFCERMVQSLLWSVLADQPLGVVADMLRTVGAQNWADGFPEALYENFAYALIQSVHYLNAYDWSSTIGSAWITYFMWIKPHLLAGAQQAAEAHAAARQEAERRAAAEREAAEREAARVTALSRDPRGGRAQVVGDVNLESVANLLDDDDDENVGYGQIMVSMTRNRRQEPPRRPRPS